MSNSKIINPALEDTLDDFSSGVTYYYAEQTFAPLRSKLSEGVSNEIVREALESGLSTLQYSVMNSVIHTVQDLVIQRVLASSAILLTYIKSGKVIKSLEKIKNKNIKMLGRVGGKILRGVTGQLLGTQDERLAIANMANNTVNNVASSYTQERQNQILMRNTRVKHFDNVLNNTQQQNLGRLEQDINLFKMKTQKGLWTTSQEDKRLYERATGKKFSQSQEVWNKGFVEKWNNVADVAKDVEGQTINQAQAFIDYITTAGYERLK